MSGSGVDRESYYGASPSGTQGMEGDRLASFDSTNAVVLLNMSCRGGLVAAIATDAREEPRGRWPGPYVQRSVFSSGPWRFTLEGEALFGDGEGLEWKGSIDWSAGVFPRLRGARGGLVGTLLAFAPQLELAGIVERPAVAYYICRLTNQGEKERRISVGCSVANSASKEQGAYALVTLGCAEGERGILPSLGPVVISLESCQSRIIIATLTIGTSEAGRLQAEEGASHRSVLEWLNSTAESTALGDLQIPDAPDVAERFARSIAQSRTAATFSPAGEFMGGFLGSDIDPERRTVHMRDSWYSILPLAHFDPNLCAAGALFHCRWGVPAESWASEWTSPIRQRGSLLDQGAFHSLGNALAGVALAGAYYCATGDHDWFASHSEFEDYARDIVDTIRGALTQRALLPSLWISDGEARGDYHTGSNIVAWHCMEALARVSDEVWCDGAFAAQCREVAETLKKGVLSRCVADTPEGPMLADGAFVDGSYVPVFDGEDSDLTLASFFGFLPRADERLVNNALAACSEVNPLYRESLGGIDWPEDVGPNFCGTTMPSWLRFLNAATVESELLRRLDDIRRVTDVDGSLWWWPYSPGETDRTRVKRRPAKSSWASGVFTCKFVADILGILLDVPQRMLSFRPFSPWPDFLWKGARLGSTKFDLQYARRDDQIELCVRNLNAEEYGITMSALLPPLTSVEDVMLDGRYAREMWSVRWELGRPLVSTRVQVGAGSETRLCVVLKQVAQGEAGR